MELKSVDWCDLLITDLHDSRPSLELMRKPVIAGNWKMYKMIAESVETALALEAAGGEREPLRGRHRAGLHGAEDGGRPARRLEHPRRGAGLLDRSRSTARTRARSRPTCCATRARRTSSSATPSGGSIYGETDAIVSRKTQAGLAPV